jgi:hypothetical protein
MRHFKIIFVLSSFLLLISGCATVPVFVNPKGAKVDLQRYKTIKAEPLQVAKGVTVSSYILQQVETSIFTSCLPYFGPYIPGVSEDAENLILQATITKYNDPDRGAEKFFFGQNALIEVKIILLDRATSQEVGEAKFSASYAEQGFLAGGLLSQTTTMDEIMVENMLMSELRQKIGLGLKKTLGK